jgi:hypothetical protein
MLWWRCYQDHVFAAPAVPPGEEMSCPAVDEESGESCGTSFIFAPFATEDEARHSPPKSGPERWAPWAR